MSRGMHCRALVIGSVEDLDNKRCKNMDSADFHVGNTRSTHSKCHDSIGVPDLAAFVLWYNKGVD
jgi:hypothetical protein